MEETTIKKTRTFPAYLSIALVIVGIIFEFISVASDNPSASIFVAALFILAGIILGILKLRKFKEITLGQKIASIIGIVLGLLAMFNVASYFIVMNKTNSLEANGAQEKLHTVYNGIQAYKKDNGQCPDNLSKLYPKYLTSTDILLDSNGKEWLTYKISTDKQNCDISYGASFGVGMQ